MTGSVYLVTSPELTVHKVISVPSERLSTVSWRTGSAQEVDLDGPGSVPSNSTSSHTTLASTRRGSGHRTVQNGVNWRSLAETAMLTEGRAT